jgi:CRISPR/Cas system CMR-associated protein Cmr1 (group 7 of RAMP superfamily)
MMLKTTHCFELLTPAWTGGAEPSELAEIRVSTIRGHLRQWLRLLYPREHLDEQIMGSAASVQDSRSSRVLLRLAAPVLSREALDLKAYTGATRHNEELQHPEAYFLWPLGVKKDGQPNKRGMLREGGCFNLEVRWYPQPGNPSALQRAAFEQALAAFGILGTIGTRSTRGYGSIWPISASFESESNLSETLATLPGSIVVRMLEGKFADGRKALAEAAKWMRSLRVGSQRFGTTTDEGRNDHDVADPASAPPGEGRVFRQALGMPLAQRFKRNNETTVVSSKFVLNGPPSDRYPSPVRIKIARIGGCHRVLVVIFKDLLLKDGTEIRLGGKPPYRQRSAMLDNGLIRKIARCGISVH